jgi:hypothetical protein
MASEDIGQVYKTQIPGYEDAADIQAALKLYHYATTTIPTNESEIVPNSIAGHLKALDVRTDSLEEIGAGSDYLDTEPVSPIDGFIWLDATSTGNGGPTYSTVIYTNDAPTEDLVDGILWVDKDSELKQTYVWDVALNDWVKVNEFSNVVEAKGDILIGNTAGNLDNLPVGNDGYVLTADSSATLGVSWQQVDVESIKISSIMGAY